MTTIKPDRPQEKWISNLRVSYHKLIEVNQVSVVQSGLHTDLMQAIGITMIVFNSISIGLKNISITINFT